MNRPSSTQAVPARGAMLRMPLRLGVVAAGVATSVLVPTGAHAAEGLSSDYRVGCTIYPDDSTGSSADPAGVTYVGDRNAASAEPSSHTLSASSFAVFPAGTGASGDDCGSVVDFTDRLTVGAGDSGLAAGDAVQVEMTVRLDADLAQAWGDDGSFSTIAEYLARLSVTSLDDCSLTGDVTACAPPLSFSETHRHQVYGGPGSGSDPDGYVEADAHREYAFETNAGQPIGDYVDEYRLVCSSYPCAVQDVHPDTGDAEVFTGTAALVVGHRYEVAGYLNVLASAYGNVDERAAVAVEEFSLGVTPAAGFEGVHLAYASAGAVADTTPPVISGAGDLAAASTDGSAVPVIWSLTAQDDRDGAVDVVCDPASGSSFPVGTTAVRCQATDAAGNVGSASFAVTVTVQAGPTVRLGQALAGLSVHAGIKNALQSKYDTAVAAFSSGRDAAGCGALRALTQQIAAPEGKKIPVADAAALRALVGEAQGEQGC